MGKENWDVKEHCLWYSMCRHLDINWSKSVSVWSISIRSILGLSHFLLFDLFNEVWREVWTSFHREGIYCETHIKGSLFRAVFFTLPSYRSNAAKRFLQNVSSQNLSKSTIGHKLCWPLSPLLIFLIKYETFVYGVVVHMLYANVGQEIVIKKSRAA